MKRSEKLKAGLQKLRAVRQETEKTLLQTEDVLSTMEDREARRVARRNADEQRMRERYGALRG